ncbi:hypothetical protein [Priestia taiwanensis]|uniref:Uncharacterized protein n=1 Tax=Priestia taiwanensis TaxID=1347902 RepID=A0A917ENN4_9BACI|nr:hypothetical protein [Priestia taiwanensis]MBM7362597.1 hypothetical protein [Priestia taiwanensis]GGE63554.1 hypothetical protein GCM10007140_12220 [Priestia taiwanensis]
MPRKEFVEHSSYTTIELVNRYVYWNIAKDTHYTIVAQPDWIIKLPINKKKDLFNIQLEVGRGLVFPLAILDNPTVIPKEYIIESKEGVFFVVQYMMWKELPYRVKEQLITEYPQQWENWTSRAVPTNIPLHLHKYANTFSSEEGSNCLAATLFAVTGQEWIIYEWLHPQAFMNGLKHAGYSVVKDEPSEDDVIVWQDEDGNIQHASYCVGNNLFFNKNGQMIFNPWKIVHWEEVSEAWKRYSMSIYRRELARKLHRE